MVTPDEARELDARLSQMPTIDVLRWAWERFGKRAAIGTSFQGAGLVLIHLSREAGLGFPVFTLDTGLLFPETVALRARLEAHFGIRIEALEPDLSVAAQAAAHGPALWERDPDLCCAMRKVVPLQSRLATLDCWITGVRREQSGTRAGAGLLELYRFDETAGRDLVKLNPMAAWKRDAVWAFLKQHGIPYNPLHDRGYRSIGCAPCTRQAGSGEDERAGRWTGFGKTECGIHTFMKRRD